MSQTHAPSPHLVGATSGPVSSQFSHLQNGARDCSSLNGGLSGLGDSPLNERRTQAITYTEELNICLL